MISTMLARARAYEQEAGGRIPDKDRPAVHLSARCGWLNDPNGFSWYDGACHLFYQYHPYTTNWGPMHWGHAVSKDLLHWTYLPAALAPDQEYDRDGCFSGSAVTLPDGRHMLTYTGVVKEVDEEGHLQITQQQCLAFGDGVDYEKYEGNPVLTAADLPEDIDPAQFRDPKVEWSGDHYSMITCCADRTRDGRILRFESPDGIHYGSAQLLISNKGRWGRVWECPDLFELDGSLVLLTSPMDMRAGDDEYVCGNGNLALIGGLNRRGRSEKAWRRTINSHIRGESPNPDWLDENWLHSSHPVDYGLDLYATQTMKAPDGRRIMVAWMQNWDSSWVGEKECPGWFGQMTLPRELSLVGNRLCQKPVRELEALRGEPVHVIGNMACTSPLQGITGCPLDLRLTLRSVYYAGLNMTPGICSLRFPTRMGYVSLSWDMRRNRLEIDRSCSGSRRAFMHRRTMTPILTDGRLEMEIIIDLYSIEIFIAGGLQTITAATESAFTDDRIMITSETPVEIEATAWRLDGRKIR